MTRADETTDQAALLEAAKQRIQRWLLSPALRKYADDTRDVVRRPRQTGPYIALSRESGAGGSLIARRLGELLGWDVLDKELLDLITQRYKMPRSMLEHVDETKANWVHDVLGAFFDSHVVSQESYVAHLERVMFLAAIHGQIVFVGRGAHRVLPREYGLAVRLVAPLKFRISRVMEIHQLSSSVAKARVEQEDEGRREFARRYFHEDLSDPHVYDMVLNVERLTVEQACRQIICLYEGFHGPIPVASVAKPPGGA